MRHWTICVRGWWDFEQEWCVQRWANAPLVAFSPMAADVVCLENPDVLRHLLWWVLGLGLLSSVLHPCTTAGSSCVLCPTAQILHCPHNLFLFCFTPAVHEEGAIPLYKGKEKRERGVFSSLLEQGVATVAWLKGGGQVKVHQDWLMQNTTRH